MKRGADGTLTYAPTDLIRFMQSPFAVWMDRFLLERPDELAPDEEDVQKQLIAGEGDKHEQAYLDRLLSDGVALVEKRQLRLRGSRAHRTGAPAHRLNRQKDVCFVGDAGAKTTELNVKRLQKRY